MLAFFANVWQSGVVGKVTMVAAAVILLAAIGGVIYGVGFYRK